MRLLPSIVVIIVLAFLVHDVVERNVAEKTGFLSPSAKRLLEECVEETSSGSDLYDCYVGVAVDLGETGVCEVIEEPSWSRDMCLKDMAVALKNIDICSLVGDVNHSGDGLGTSVNFREICTKSVKSITADFSSCMSRPTTGERNLCIQELGLRLTDLDECDRIRGRIGWDYCVRGVCYGLRDWEVCSKIIKDDIRWEGYRELAFMINNPHLCMQIREGVQRDACITDIALENRDPGLCMEIRGDADDCYTGLSRILGNHSLCLQAADYEMRDDCLTHHAEKTGNPGLCMKVTGSQRMSDCSLLSSKKLFEQRFENPGVCLNMTDRGTRDQCLGEVATAMQKPGYCTRINDSQARDECLWNTSISQNNMTVCTMASNPDVVDSCTTELAVRQVDHMVCRRLNESQKVDDCITRIAVDQRNKDWCEWISDSLNHDMCFAAVGKILNDETVCMKLRNPANTALCRAAM